MLRCLLRPCFSHVAIGSISSRKPDLSEAARSAQVPTWLILSITHFPPYVLLIQSRAASCCSTLAAALKSVVLNKAQWSLLDGQWGEYLASVAAIDPDSVHEVCHRLLSPFSCCFFQGPQFTSRCPLQRSRASKLSIRCTTYFWCTLFFFSCFDVFVRFSCVLQRRAASIASHKF